MGDSLQTKAEKAAMGWYGDDVATFANAAHVTELAALAPNGPAVTGNINEQHADPNQIYAGQWKLADRNQKLGGLESEQDRLKLLNQFTQNDSKVGDPAGMSGTRCGSTVLIAAAIQGGGIDGVKAIIGQANADLDPNSPFYDKQKEQMKALQESMKGGTLKMGDLHSLNGILNQQLMAAEQKKYEGKVDDNGNPIVPLMGVEPDILKEYIAKNAAMKGYFAKGNMSIESVDADGVTPPGADNGADHFVLHLAGEGGGSAIYDPFARKDHDQLVFNPEEQKNYQRHQYKPDQIDGSAFGGSAFAGMYD
ncbi:MAG TPA: hypothetical protein VKE22_08295 [Haliangiales bacterium]|nr:hypothetical protein [Haliangiales bacterium]